MDATRPLHDVFADLAGTGDGEPAEVLRANGHEDLPDGLVAEAVVNYADTAPMEVAEHLAPFVRAHSPVPSTDPSLAAPTWLDALRTAPAMVDPGTDLDAATNAFDLGADEAAGLDPTAFDPGTFDPAAHDATADEAAFGQGDSGPAYGPAAQPPADEAPIDDYPPVDATTPPGRPEEGLDALGIPSTDGGDGDDLGDDPARLDDLDG